MNRFHFPETFTMYRDNCIDEKIASQLQSVSEWLLRKLMGVEALVLLGGFARGEGSVIEEQSEFIPLGDYDILVVNKYPSLSSKVKGSKNLKFFAKSFKIDHIDIACIWKQRLPFVDKRLFWYEAKFGSKVIFGDRKVLNLIPIQTINDVDLSEGIRLLGNRLIEMFLYFDPCFLNREKITYRKAKKLIFHSVKAILACGESLLLLNRKYNPSYYQRGQLFKESFSIDFERFASENPRLKEDYLKATKFKLWPSFKIYPDPLEQWFVGKNHILKTLLFFWEEYRNQRISFNAFSLHLLQKSNEITQNFLDYIVFNRNMIEYQRSFSGLFQLRRSFSDIVRASAFYLALSVSKNGIKKEHLNHARRLIQNIVPLDNRVIKRNLMRNWRMVRKAILMAWNYSRC